jgi:hypothetical protein
MANDHDPSDVVLGAAAIAAVLNIKPSQAFYLLKRGNLPARKIGAKWITSKRILLASILPKDGE